VVLLGMRLTETSFVVHVNFKQLQNEGAVYINSFIERILC
jgi:hypothetical protein